MWSEMKWDRKKGVGMNPDEFYSVETCIGLRRYYPQGRTRYLWHKNKHNRDKWELYERSPHDISSFGDSHGYGRWVSAIPKSAKDEVNRLIEEYKLEGFQVY
jgi:hypothetical protein